MVSSFVSFRFVSFVSFLVFKKKTVKREASVSSRPEIVSLVQESSSKGASLKKFNNGKPLTHDLALDPTATSLISKNGHEIDIASIREIRLGFASQEFFSAEGVVPEDNAITIVYAESSKGPPAMLNLVADSSHTRNWWHKTLMELMDRIAGKEGEVFAILKPWLSNLREGKDTMSWKTAIETLESMGMKTSAERSKQLIAEFDKDGNDRLDFGEFFLVLRRLRSHKALADLYAKSTKDQVNGMTASELIAVFKKEQNQTLSTEDAARMIKSVSANNDTLDSDEFELLMIGKDNEVFDPELQKVHHNMNQPLNRYFINSSHNTYLVGDQLKSNSSIEMYVRAFRLGCRCVELDIWDGPNGEPIIYHGYTLTSKILFSDILKVVKRQGFAKSPYPIILSLENHCSLGSQDRIAHLLETILGDMIEKPSNGKMSELPSPEKLKNKVLIKAKSHATSAIESDLTLQEDGEEIPEFKKTDLPAPEEQGKSKISERLAKLIFLPAASFKSFEYCAGNWSANKMSSFSELKTQKLIAKDNGASLRAYNAKFLSRVYPKGSRFDSSNYMPIPAWNANCQIVALNFQTSSIPMFINHAKFRENGSSGYNLQPDVKDPQTPISLTVCVLGARNLPQRSKIDILDPYVVVTFVDGSEKPPTFVSNVVMDNGLNPNFSLECSATMASPRHSFLVISVFDQNPGQDAFVGQCAIPVYAVRSGYRSALLMDEQFAALGKGLGHVLLHIKIKK